MNTIKQKAVIFIDAANMFYSQKSLGWDFDYVKIYHYFAQKYDIFNAFFYTGIIEGDDNKRKFLNALINYGYTVREKKVKNINTNNGKIEKKANVDIEIVVDMFNIIDKYNVAILFSGDCDFERAMELLRSRGKEIIVVSTRGHISLELRNATDKYIDLIDIKGEIQKSRQPN